MQISIDTTKDEKEDIEKAIEILSHFLNKQPKASIITNKPLQPAQQQQTIQRPQLQRPALKPIEQPIKINHESPRQELKRIDPDLNNLNNNNNISNKSNTKQHEVANTPETEDFLNKMLEEIDTGKESDDFEDDENEKTEKEVERVPFGSTEIVKHQKEETPEEDPEFKFDDLEKY